MLHECLECGKIFADLRSHLSKHKMTVHQYQEKHGVSIIRSAMVTIIYVLAPTYSSFEHIKRKIGTSLPLKLVRDMQDCRGFSPNTRVICTEVSEHEFKDACALHRNIDAIKAYDMLKLDRKCKIQFWNGG